MTCLYKVTVRYDTIAPMFQEETFMFPNEQEANTFCTMVELETDWAYTVPAATSAPEIFEADTAFNWIKDEIKACKAAVNAHPEWFPHKARAMAKAN
jgi:hypothetical protein